MHLLAKNILIAFLSMHLTACLFAGPSFDAEQGGQLVCYRPIEKNETVVVQGDNCLIDHLAKKAAPIKVLPSAEIQSISIPRFSEHEKIRQGYVFGPKDTGLPVLGFLRDHKAEDAIKEHQIRYFVFIEGNSYEEPLPEPYSAEDWEAAFFGSYREESSVYSALVVDAQEALVSGSILQESKGTNIIIPLLLIFSDPDPTNSACEAIASSLLKMFKGNCKSALP